MCSPQTYTSPSEKCIGPIRHHGSDLTSSASMHSSYNNWCHRVIYGPVDSGWLEHDCTFSSSQLLISTSFRFTQCFSFFVLFPNTPNQLYLVGDPFCKSHPHLHLRHMGMCILLYICSLYFLYFVRTYKLDLLSFVYRIKINVIYTYKKFAKQHLKNISHTSSQTSASTPICISGELKFVNSRSK